MSGIDPTSLNRISGLASGLDIDSMVSSLMKAARLPEDKLKQSKQIWQWKQEDYRSINTSLLDLRNTVFNLKLQGTFQVMKTSSSDESVVTATASAAAIPTTYQVKVEQLATVATNSSSSSISARAVLLGNSLSGAVDTTPANRFKLSYDGGAAVDITLAAKVYDGTPGNTLNDLAADIQSQIDAAIGSGKITVSLTTDNRIKLAATAKSDGTVPVIVVNNGDTSNALPVLNLTDGQTSAAQSAIDPAASLWSQKDRFLSSNFGWNAADHTLTFTINGQSFTFNGDTDSLNTVIKTVNSNASAGVNIFYDSSVDKIGIATVKTGDNRTGKEIQVAGSCFLTDVLRLDENNEKGGQDASFEINGLSGITSHTNSYTVNGVTFNFKGTTAGGLSGSAATVTVTNDIDSIVNTIKDFVNKYNDTLNTINSKLYEERYTDYLPLTDEELSSGKLTDKQIDQWTEKARSGLLKYDPLLQGAADAMRNALTGIVNGLNKQVTVSSNGQMVTAVANQLSVIGITTGSYEEHGKLYLDENRLREALQSNPQAVMDLFTRTSDDAGNKITDSKQKGLAVQLYDAVNNAISRITTEAGSSSALYDNSNIGQNIRDIDQQIADMEERLQDLEDRYYRQFTAMEEAIAQMNSQSAWLSQQLGSQQK